MDQLIELLNSPLTVWIVVYLLAIVFISRLFHIAKEGERFAKVILGRFVGYFGPGLVISMSSPIIKLHRLRVGQVGRLLNSELAEFQGLQIPVKNVDGIRGGSAVRIDDFDGDGPKLVVSESQPKTMCPKCHHQF